MRKHTCMIDVASLSASANQQRQYMVRNGNKRPAAPSNLTNHRSAIYEMEVPNFHSKGQEKASKVLFIVMLGVKYQPNLNRSRHRRQDFSKVCRINRSSRFSILPRSVTITRSIQVSRAMPPTSSSKPSSATSVSTQPEFRPAIDKLSILPCISTLLGVAIRARFDLFIRLELTKSARCKVLCNRLVV